MSEVVVTQADREVAADFIISADTETMVRWGKADRQPLVQAFALHRQQSCAELIEALKAVLPFLEGPRLAEEGRAASGEIQRMPVRTAHRKAVSALAKALAHD